MAQNENILTRLGKLFQSNIIVRKTPSGQLRVKDVNFGQSTTFAILQTFEVWEIFCGSYPTIWSIYIQHIQ